MPDDHAHDVPGDGADAAVWRRLSRDRPWYRKLAAQPLAEGRVRSPDGYVFIVRVRKNSPVVGLKGMTSPDLPAFADVVRASVKAAGDTGWRIDVVAPPRGWRSERVLYTQHVGAQAILVDVVLAISDALERGDVLWPVDEE